MRYATFQLENGVGFVHVAFTTNDPGPLPELEAFRRFQADMTVVVPPNVGTPDETAGVQTGELLLVTARGAARLHAAPRRLRRVG